VAAYLWKDVVFGGSAGMVAASRLFYGANQPDLNFFILNQLSGHDD